MKELYERIRDLREDHDLKQSEVAERIGTTQQYYSKYETGRHELPIRFLNKLAELYGVSTDYILGRTDCPDGVNKYGEKLTDDYSVDELVGDVLSLSPKAREAVKEYVELWKDRKSK